MSTRTEANGYDGGKLTAVLTVSKLSKLQRCILGLALENRSRESRDDSSNGADVYHAEIMAAAFGFKAVKPPSHYDRTINLRNLSGGHAFRPTKIGKAKYDAAAASISRACARLQQRDLVVRVNGAFSKWAGVDLTPSGIACAQGLPKARKKAGNA